MKKFLYVLLGIFVVISLAVGAGVWYVNSLFDEVFVSDKEDPNAVDVMVNEGIKNKKDNVENYALFGVDCRTENYEGCRSDVMMVISYNKDTNNATLVSVPRDTYVDIKDRGFDKINHSYAFGGPTLAVQTLNRAFDLDIEHYVSVNFAAVESIVDAIGGVEVYIDSYEIGQVPGISTEGLHKLNGEQAVTYSRIRYVGDGDFERMERQREVMESALATVSSSNLTQLMGLVESLLPLVRTNMPSGEVMNLLTSVMTKGIPTLAESQVPAQDKGVGTKINGVYYFVPNTLLDSAISLHELIHPKTTYTPSQTVTNMSKEIESQLN